MKRAEGMADAKISAQGQKTLKVRHAELFVATAHMRGGEGSGDDDGKAGGISTVTDSEYSGMSSAMSSRRSSEEGTSNHRFPSSRPGGATGMAATSESPNM